MNFQTTALQTSLSRAFSCTSILLLGTLSLAQVGQKFPGKIVPPPEILEMQRATTQAKKLLDVGRYADAEDQARAASELIPPMGSRASDKGSWLLTKSESKEVLVDALIRQGHNREALSICRELVADLEHYQAVGTTTDQARYQLGLLLCRMGRVKESAALASPADFELVRAPEYRRWIPTLTDRNSVEAYWLLAEFLCAHVGADYATCIWYGEQAKRVIPHNALLRRELGDSYLRVRRYADAVPELEAAVQYGSGLLQIAARDDLWVARQKAKSTKGASSLPRQPGKKGHGT